MTEEATQRLETLRPSHRALRLPGILALAFVVSQVLVPAYAATTYTMTLQTDSPSYVGSQSIKITGVISPAPGPNTAVVITVRNSVGSIADVNEVFPSPTNGSFADTSVPGGNPAWTNGTFSVNATWGGNGATASQVVTFVYSPVATSTSASSTTTTTSSTTKITATVATSTTPEFPSSVLAMVALVGLALVAALSRRIPLRPPGSVGR